MKWPTKVYNRKAPHLSLPETTTKLRFLLLNHNSQVFINFFVSTILKHTWHSHLTRYFKELLHLAVITDDKFWHRLQGNPVECASFIKITDYLIYHLSVTCLQPCILDNLCMQPPTPNMLTTNICHTVLNRLYSVSSIQALRPAFVFTRPTHLNTEISSPHIHPKLTLSPLTWKIWWAPNNASGWDLTRRLKG
jgi:hypothetical protein